jgi:hypothetical protein
MLVVLFKALDAFVGNSLYGFHALHVKFSKDN